MTVQVDRQPHINHSFSTKPTFIKENRARNVGAESHQNTIHSILHLSILAKSFVNLL